MSRSPGSGGREPDRSRCRASGAKSKKRPQPPVRPFPVPGEERDGRQSHAKPGESQGDDPGCDGGHQPFEDYKHGEEEGGLRASGLPLRKPPARAAVRLKPGWWM